ncbi:hypothetical protein ACFV4K_13810 [Nocardia sp. NPDC059764]|uniref:hypothetical protein n=1 Tax=Nocardia sp. NPDC059764 TaxID=3346939 RepID=UPI00365ED77E
MITANPIGLWQWSWDYQGEFQPVLSPLNELISVMRVLDSRGLSRRSADAHLIALGRQVTLYDATIALDVDSTIEDLKRIAAQVSAAAGEKKVLLVQIFVDCSPSAYFADRIEVLDGALRIGVIADVGDAPFMSVHLQTNTDVWMPYDLRGVAQQDTFQRNGPRLTAALDGIAEVLGVETEPDDPTLFAKPTISGLRNHLDENGYPEDTGFYERTDIASESPSVRRSIE